MRGISVGERDRAAEGEKERAVCRFVYLPSYGGNFVTGVIFCGGWPAPSPL